MTGEHQDVHEQGRGSHGAADRELATLLARVRRRWFALVALTTVTHAALGTAAVLALFVLLGAVTRPSGGWLVAAAAVTVGTAVFVVVRTLWRMQRRPDDRRVARFVGEWALRTGEDTALGDTLVTALDVSAQPHRHAAAFGRLVITKAVDSLRRAPASVVLPSGVLRRRAAGAAAAAAALALAFALAAPLLLRAGVTAWVALFPHRIVLQVLTGDVRVPAGRPLQIEAHLAGRGARLLDITPRLVVSAAGDEREVAMQAAGGRFVYPFESVDRTFQYRVVAGAVSSRPFTITALFAPQVTSIDLRYEYPAFTRLAPRTEAGAGDVYAPAGTRVGLRIHTDKPVTGGALALADGASIPLHAGARAATAEFVVSRASSYRVKLSGTEGLDSTGEVEYFIRVMEDRPPTVHIVRPGSDQGITPLEEVRIEAEADDDHGIAAMELVYAVGGQPERSVAFRTLSKEGPARTGSHLLAAEELAVQPGDVITYYARARDLPRGRPSREGKSDMFFLEVKPFNEEFEAAQSQGGGGGAAAMQIERLIASQKEIITATWNLERRAHAGRSTDDAHALAAAQSELKARAERMVGAGRRAPRVVSPQQILPPRPSRPAGGANAVASAAEAMGRAADHLQGTRTREALPHELAALQGLLQAQAEVRRRQVMQQSASAGGGGTSRTDRDLSALFDRELQRQQRTNYEAPRQSAESGPPPGDDLLERIRDLARRQEDLARRQRELAQAAASEERKRELARLTREQEELRQQMQSLAREPRSGGGGSKGSAGQQERMQRAADDMNRAATELQRQNAAAAAASGERAGRALGEIAEQLRGATGAARERASGEMRLEAQQLAEAQQRIAHEMERLQQDAQAASGATRDAVNRLAAEKDRLADRVDALQRGLRQAAREGSTTAGSSAAAAAHLERADAGQSMRSSAAELRRSGRPHAEPERQLARTLDTVASALGGGRQDKGDLAGQLQQTSALRDRLNRLEAQLREAERAEAGGGRGRASDGTGSGSEVQRLRDEYARELRRVRESLGRTASQQQKAGAGATPEQHEFSRSAPGNESFKQDFTSWEALRKEVDLAIERHEAAASARQSRSADDRLAGGGSEQVPEAYRGAVSRYFESLASRKK